MLSLPVHKKVSCQINHNVLRDLSYYQTKVSGYHSTFVRTRFQIEIIVTSHSQSFTKQNNPFSISLISFRQGRKVAVLVGTLSIHSIIYSYLSRSRKGMVLKLLIFSFWRSSCLQCITFNLTKQKKLIRSAAT